jgi:ATP synthase protein I
MKKNISLNAAWRVIAVQAVVGLIVCVLVGMFIERQGAVVSALCGVCIALMPQALFVRGLSQPSSANAQAILARFLIWEVLKIAAALLLMGLAAALVPHLSWPILLLAMIVCMKACWLVPLLKQRVFS